MKERMREREKIHTHIWFVPSCVPLTLVHWFPLFCIGTDDGGSIWLEKKERTKYVSETVKEGERGKRGQTERLSRKWPKRQSWQMLTHTFRPFPLMSCWRKWRQERIAYSIQYTILCHSTGRCTDVFAREHQHFRLILQIDDNYNEEGEQKVLEGDSYKESMGERNGWK
jgi:hypothetical protein